MERQKSLRRLQWRVVYLPVQILRVVGLSNDGMPEQTLCAFDDISVLLRQRFLFGDILCHNVFLKPIRSIRMSSRDRDSYPANGVVFAYHAQFDRTCLEWAGVNADNAIPGDAGIFRVDDAQQFTAD